MPNPVQRKRFKRLGIHQPPVKKEEFIEEIVDEATAKINELKTLNKSELIALAEQLELDTTGTKADLIDRILGE